VKMSETPGRPTTAAPLVGQHTAETLLQLLGMNTGKIDRLIEGGVIPRPQSPEGGIMPQGRSDPAERP
jgi:hypothetical protein